MHAYGRRGARTWGAAAVLLAALVGGCGSQPASPSPSPTVTPTPTTMPAPTPTPVAYADTLRLGIDAGMQRGWAWWDLTCDKLGFGRLVYSALYRCDGHYNVVPDLTDGLCFVPGDDGKVLRCRLIDTKFQDGTPLTADDVAYTYQLFNSDPWFDLGFDMGLKEVRVVDPRTVEFVLESVDPTFLTGVLPIFPIFPRHAVEAAHADLMTRLAAAGLSAEDYAKLSDTVNDEINRDPAVCSQARIDQVDALYAKLDVHDYREDHLGPGGTFDRCSYLGDAAGPFWSASYILRHTGNDRLGAALGWNAYGHPFPGTGPYRLVYQDANTEHLEAWPGYHGGVAATRYIDIVKGKPDGSDLVAGTIDIGRWAIDWTDATGRAFRATAPAHGVEVVTPPTGGYYHLAFNVREGRLFADVNLRKALQLCIDLPRAVDAATGGDGTPVYSPVMPGSWAYDADLPKPERDVAAGKRLIEASGWQLGSDGIYAKGGVQLAAQVLGRAGATDRVKMADLIANQAHDCGMDLESLPLGDDAYYSVLQTFPHDVPGTKTPFEIALSGWSGSTQDPGAGDLWPFLSSNISDAEHPDGGNIGGFSDPAFDQLVAAANATYDQAERARLFRQAQEELAAQLPAIFLWGGHGYDAVRSTVTSVDGPLDLAVPNWAWAPERMVVANP